MQGVQHIPYNLPGEGGYDPAVGISPVDPVLILFAVGRVAGRDDQIALLILPPAQILPLEPKVAQHPWLSIDQRLIDGRLVSSCIYEGVPDDIRIGSSIGEHGHIISGENEEDEVIAAVYSQIVSGEIDPI